MFAKALSSLLVVSSMLISVQAYNADATYFDVGLGSCGAWSKNSDYVVALSSQEYNWGAHCWRHIKIHYEGRTIDATVVDACPGCSRYDLDLSPSAFKALASLDKGRIKVDWEFA